MFAVQHPGAHARQQRALQRHAAVATVDGVEVDETLVGPFIAVGREPGLAHDEQHLVGVRLHRLLALRVEPLAQRARLVEHRLRRHAPFVRGLAGFVVVVAVPPVVLLHTLQVLAREPGPGFGAVQRELRVQQVGLQLQEAGHLRHQLARLAVAQRAAEAGQRVAEGVVAAQALHRRPGAAVGRAQHQQARALALHQAVEGLRPLQLHRARQHAAHAVRDDAHRLPAAVARVQRGLHRVGQAARFFLERAAPVEAEGDDLVRLRQVVHQVVVDEADRAVGLHGVGAVGRAIYARRIRQLAQAADQPQAEPDAFVAGLQVAAQDAGQHEDRRLLARGAAVGGAAACGAQPAGIVARPRQRPDGAKACRRGLREARHHGLHGALVGKVVEVRGLAALVQHEARAAGARAAAVHAARLHDDVVVGPVVGVGQQRLQPAADAVALQVAGDHAQVTGDGFFIAVEPVHQRRVGDHAGQAGQLLGVGAAARHLRQKVHHRRHHRHAGELDRPLQHRQVGVEPLAGQQRAAGRAGHAHHAVDLDALGGDGRGQRLQLAALPRVILTRKEGQVGGADRPLLRHAPAHQRQHLGHETAARVRGQVQPRARRQRIDERQRVGDRAHADGGVVERVDAAAVVVEQRGHALRVQRPELAEGAEGVDEGAVDQHQQRLLRRGGRCGHGCQLVAAALQRRQRLALQRVDPRVDLTVDLGDHGAGDEVDRLVGGQTGDDLEGLQHHVAQKAAAARGRGAFQALPAQLCRHGHLVGQGLAGAAPGAGLAEHQVARRGRVQHQRRAAGDAQHHHVFTRHRAHAHAVAADAATAARRHTHRGLQRAGQTGGHRRAGGRAAAGLALAGDDEGDRCVVLRGHASGSPSEEPEHHRKARADQAVVCPDLGRPPRSVAGSQPCGRQVRVPAPHSATAPPSARRGSRRASGDAPPPAPRRPAGRAGARRRS